MNKEIRSMFIDFISDEIEPYMYITGSAGTGKTTDLKNTTEYCIDNDISYVVCAYTHKAVGILKDKLPKNANICTLHSYLKKCPTVNTEALKMNQLESNVVNGTSESKDVIIVDEFSMVGNRDYEDIQAVQWDLEGKLVSKVLFIGDLNQLPPVGDMQSITPRDPYWINLTKIYRQEGNSELLGTLQQLVSFLDGQEPTALIEHSTFKREVDIEKEYLKFDDSVILAYTNERVQTLNRRIEQKSILCIGDNIFSPTLRKFAHVERILDAKNVHSIQSIIGDELELNSKYRTLETLLTLDVQFVDLKENETGVTSSRAVVFGHRDFLDIYNSLKRKAVSSNKKIESRFKCTVKDWCSSNSRHSLAIKRAKCWKEFLSFNQNVICVDYTHAMTVHKSQGSTYSTVFIDVEDISKCADKNYTLYIKLMYVAISRASNKVFTN